MPHDILRIVTTHVGEVNTTAYADAWSLITSWCLLAGQASTTGESLVSFSVEAITEVEDDYLGKWLEQSLDTTMGPRPQGGAPLTGAQRGGVIRIHAAGKFRRGHRERGRTRAKSPWRADRNGATRRGHE